MYGTEKELLKRQKIIRETLEMFYKEQKSLNNQIGNLEKENLIILDLLDLMKNVKHNK